MSEELDQVLARHKATKHSFARMASGPKGMDVGIEPAPVGGRARRSWSSTGPSPGPVWKRLIAVEELRLVRGLVG